MSGQPRQASLWDVDDVTGFGAVANMAINPVEQIDVREFCRRWHYTNSGGSALWNYGLYDGDVLVGVVSYNIPTLRTCASLFGKEHAAEVVHMGRLVCADDAPRNSESRLIAASLKMLYVESQTWRAEELSDHYVNGHTRDCAPDGKCDWQTTKERDNTWKRPELRAVITFAAEDAGHIGYVYQATNALYTGTGGYSKNYTTADGRAISTNGKCGPEEMERLRRLGVEMTRAKPKHRYVYLLGNKTKRKESRRMLKLPVLPYPKPDATPNREETQ